MGVLDTMAAATAGTASVTLIMDAALDARWDALSKELEAAATSDADTGSLAMPATTKVVNEMEKIREQVLASQVTFTFEHLDWRARVALQAEHPPRQGNMLDQIRGYNVVAFTDALVRRTCIKVVDAAGDEATEIPAETWDRLLGNPEADPPVKGALSFGQVQKLHAAAYKADEGATAVPPSARSLLESQDSGASLAQPSPGPARRRSGSAAGSRRGSRKSSTAKKAASTKAGSSGS